MSRRNAIRGSEPDDVIPSDWDAYLNAGNAEVIFSVHPYMVAPEIEGFQSDGVLDSTAGVIIADLRGLIEDYIEDCINEDYGEGLLTLADLFTEYAEKLRARKIEIRDELAAQKEYDSKCSLVFPN